MDDRRLMLCWPYRQSIKPWSVDDVGCGYEGWRDPNLCRVARGRTAMHQPKQGAIDERYVIIWPDWYDQMCIKIHKFIEVASSLNLTFWLVVGCHQRLFWLVAKPKKTEKREGPKCQHLFGLTILPLPFFRLNNYKQKPQEKPGWICKY